MANARLNVPSSSMLPKFSMATWRKPALPAVIAAVQFFTDCRMAFADRSTPST
ncbi:hypothetical protein KRR40_26550 [Niabella defluvii]|nr:hypothetical protein KRR40_26550 [Niabella sp. I65]